ncbi:MAG TPA: GNAT family N-acetyltransferase [Baekduia sp.]
METERLRLRRWRPEDRAGLAAINGDAEVMRWIGSGRVLGRGLSDELVDRFEAEWRDRGYGLWAVEWKDGGGGLLGFCGLTSPSFMVDADAAPAAEIGWRLARAAWGRGVATEAARAAVAYGFGERCGLREIVAVVAPENARSLRVVEKLGMEPRPDRWHAPSRGRVKVFGLRPER